MATQHIKLKFTPGETERSYGIRVGEAARRAKRTVEVTVTTEVGLVNDDGTPVMETVAAPVNVQHPESGTPIQMMQPVTRQRVKSVTRTYTFRDNGNGIPSNRVNQRWLLPSVARAIASCGLDLDVRECDGSQDGFVLAQDKKIVSTSEDRKNLKIATNPLAGIMETKPERRARLKREAQFESETAPATLNPDIAWTPADNQGASKTTVRSDNEIRKVQTSGGRR